LCKGRGDLNGFLQIVAVVVTQGGQHFVHLVADVLLGQLYQALSELNGRLFECRAKGVVAHGRMDVTNQGIQSLGDGVRQRRPVVGVVLQLYGV
jgi:hypothetical protein